MKDETNAGDDGERGVECKEEDEDAKWVAGSAFGDHGRRCVLDDPRLLALVAYEGVFIGLEGVFSINRRVVLGEWKAVAAFIFLLVFS